jgi:hypothetical protein
MNGYISPFNERYRGTTENYSVIKKSEITMPSGTGDYHAKRRKSGSEDEGHMLSRIYTPISACNGCKT